MSNDYEFPIQIRYQIFEIVRKNIGLPEELIEVLKSTHRVFEKQKEAHSCVDSREM